MRKVTLACVALSLAGCVQQSAITSGTQAPLAGKDEQVMRLVPSNVERPLMPEITTAPDGTISIGAPKSVKLSKGELEVGSEDVNFYLPSKGPYSTTSAKNHMFENTSTPICVDSNHDGVMSETETWWASLPIRLGDQMFTVKQIDPGGTWICFAKSSAPLNGVIVGKPCPAFTFKTTDGKQVSLADFKGKAVLLDVWSMT